MSKIISDLWTDMLHVQITETVENGWRTQTVSAEIKEGLIHKTNLTNDARFKIGTEAKITEVISVERPVYEDE